jgi:hypothetical protein
MAMKAFNQIAWRWRLPMLVLPVQLLTILMLRMFFSNSTSHSIKMFYLLVAYPFINSMLVSTAWLFLLFVLGWTLEKKKPS